MSRELINGVLLGGLYATVGLGLTIVVGVMRLVNLAHGELLVVAAYLVGFLNHEWQWDPLVAAVVVAPVMALAAYPVQRLVLTPTMRYGFEPPLVATFGIAITVQTLLVIWATSDPRSLSASYATESIEILGTTVRVVMLLALGIGIVLALALQLFMVRSSFGRELRAAAEDPAAAETVGVNVGHVYGIALGLSAAVATFGGTLIGIAYSYSPNSGLGWLLRAFTVVVIGGLGSIPGAVLGGLVLGIVEELGAEWFGPQYRDVVVFLALCAVLVARPQGILARRVAT
jgi:branched-chain amino acid transport system permease protein